MSYTAFKERFGIELNAQQEEAVQAIDGSVLLLAVPGSGKTTVLVNRLGYMILECGIAPENILTITYTDAATKDMKQRFAKKFGDQYGERVEFRTINGISQKILMFYGRQIGQKPYDIIDKKVQASEDITPKMVKERMDEKWPSHPLSVGLIESMMDWLKGSLSIEEMFDINDVRLNDSSLVTGFTEDEINVSNLDSRTRSYFGKLFEKMTDKDWLVFLKNNGMLGDDLQDMEAEEFSETEIYYTVFGKKIGANAKEKMTKTVYNRTIKVNRIMDGIPYNVKKEYVKEFKEYFEEQVERIISEYFE